MPHALTDMHCHLQFATEGEHVAECLQNEDTALFTNTIKPTEWASCLQTFEPFSNVVVGCGWHPWGITEDASVETLLEQLELFQPTALGEIGLDFSKNHCETGKQQRAIFNAFAEWAAAADGCLLSIHAVNAATQALEILQRAGAFDSCTCIFHWFSGTSNDLNLALDRGCFFSINQRMLASRRGLEYVKQIPPDRLLLESDLPSEPQTNLTAHELVESLMRTSEMISSLKGTDCIDLMNKTARGLLGIPLD